MIFGSRLSAQERQEICTLVYYPVEKIKLLKGAECDYPVPGTK